MTKDKAGINIAYHAASELPKEDRQKIEEYANTLLEKYKKTGGDNLTKDERKKLIARLEGMLVTAEREGSSVKHPDIKYIAEAGTLKGSIKRLIDDLRREGRL